jgi:hypothetical protein
LFGPNLRLLQGAARLARGDAQQVTALRPYRGAFFFIRKTKVRNTTTASTPATTRISVTLSTCPPDEEVAPPGTKSISGSSCRGNGECRAALAGTNTTGAELVIPASSVIGDGLRTDEHCWIGMSRSWCRLPQRTLDLRFWHSHPAQELEYAVRSTNRFATGLGSVLARFPKIRHKKKSCAGGNPRSSATDVRVSQGLVISRLECHK